MKTAVLLVFLAIFLCVVRFHSFPDIIDMQQIDMYRDYLVADHIVTNHEYPLSGPQNSFSSFRNSPAYYYLLAFFLLIYNDFLFLQLINILLQICSGILLFFLYRKFSNTIIAFAGTVLYTTSYAFLTHSFYLWQPYLMESILIGAFLLYADYIVKADIKKMYWSFFLLILAFALHLSVLPVLLFLSALAMYREYQNKGPYIKLLLLISTLLVVFFAPTVWVYLTEKQYTNISSAHIFDTQLSFTHIANKLYYNVTFFFKNSFYEYYNLLLFSSLIPFIGYFFKHDSNKNSIAWSMVMVVFHFVVLTTVSRVAFSHYYIPILPAYFFLLAYTWFHLIKDVRFSTILYYCVIVILLYVFTLNGKALTPIKADLSYTEITRGTQALSKSIQNLSKIDRQAKNNFQIVIIWKDLYKLDWQDSPFFMPQLEKSLDTQIAFVTNNKNSLKILNGQHYLYLMCYDYSSISTCTKTAESLNKPYKMSETIYEGENYQILLYRQAISQ